MDIKEIAKGLRSQVRQWRLRIAGKSTEPVSPHPSQQILYLLGQVYHHIDFPRGLDLRCKELITEVEESIPKWPSLEFGDDYKLPILGHINNFADLLATAEPQGQWSKPMTKLSIMNALGIDSYKKLRTYGKVHPIRNAGSTKMWQINLEGLNEVQIEKLLKA